MKIFILVDMQIDLIIADLRTIWKFSGWNGGLVFVPQTLYTLTTLTTAKCFFQNMYDFSIKVTLSDVQCHIRSQFSLAFELRQFGRVKFC